VSFHVLNCVLFLSFCEHRIELLYVLVAR
jgi:hypothetical protein